MSNVLLRKGEVELRILSLTNEFHFIDTNETSRVNLSPMEHQTCHHNPQEKMLTDVGAQRDQEIDMHSYKISHELWVWAKSQVLASLRPVPALNSLWSNELIIAKKAATNGKGETMKDFSTKDFATHSSLRPVAAPSTIIRPSRTHQELHKELLLTHRKGLGLRSKPELLKVLERRRCQQENKELQGHEKTPLEQELQKRLQRKEQISCSEVERYDKCIRAITVSQRHFKL